MKRKSKTIESCEVRKLAYQLLRNKLALLVKIIEAEMDHLGKEEA